MCMVYVYYHWCDMGTDGILQTASLDIITPIKFSEVSSCIIDSMMYYKSNGEKLIDITS